MTARTDLSSPKQSGQPVQRLSRAMAPSTSPFSCGTSKGPLRQTIRATPRRSHGSDGTRDPYGGGKLLSFPVTQDAKGLHSDATQIRDLGSIGSTPVAPWRLSATIP